MSETSQRLRFNELVNLLRSLDSDKLQTTVALFPKLTEEVTRGPDAGGVDSEYESVLYRANFSDELCLGILDAGQARTEKVLVHASSISSSRIAVVLIGGVLGAAMLTAVGLSKDEVARISGIATAVLAVLNAAIETYAKRYSSAEVKKAIDVRQALLKLKISHNTLRAAIRSREESKTLIAVTEQCNEQAYQLSKSLDDLQIV